MIVQTWNIGWTLQLEGRAGRIPATVPGSVYSDLLAAGKLEDPYWRDNEDKALALMEQDFRYQLTFVPEAAILACAHPVLRFEGVDTLGEIRLNGVLLGRVENMHRTFSFEVGGILRPGKNWLEVTLRSPTRYLRESYAESPADGSEEAMRGFPNLRKAHCMFGWDWGPRLPDAGIWRPVSLLGVQEGMIESVLIRQRHENGRVTLTLAPELAFTGETPLTYTVELTDPQGNVEAYGGSPREILVEHPQLWWPRGYGDQPLYTVKVTLWAGGRETDVWQRRIGLRTVTVHREKDEYGESFAHEVNGVRIFAMGADYIPEDSILPRMNPQRTRRLLEQCAAANFNSIRVWGGGHYPSDAFYDACDELGLLVWQDLMFACAVYNLTPEFAENIRAEVRDNVRRLRHHASLGMWCGNNEMEMFVDQGRWVRTPRQKADYIRMYEYLIPEVLRQEDPDAFYWPASPSSGGGFDQPNDPSRGDVHYWAVWHGMAPFADYRKHRFRYLSEFGFESFP